MSSSFCSTTSPIPIRPSRLPQKIVASLSQPIDIGRFQAPVSVSVGVCPVTDEFCTFAELLLRCADAAMYLAKETGRSCFRRFSLPDMTVATRARAFETYPRRTPFPAQIRHGCSIGFLIPAPSHTANTFGSPFAGSLRQLPSLPKSSGCGNRS